jgi:hypothetical protein
MADLPLHPATEANPDKRAGDRNRNKHERAISR